MLPNPDINLSQRSTVEVKLDATFPTLATLKICLGYLKYVVYIKYSSLYVIYIEASRDAGAQSVTVKPTGCGFDPHSRR